MSRGRSERAVAEQVERDHAVAARGEVFGQRPVHLLGEQQAVQQDQRPRGARRCARSRPRHPRRSPRRPAAVLGVGEPLSLELEERHPRTLLPGAALIAAARIALRRGRRALALRYEQRSRPEGDRWPSSPASSPARRAAITGGARGIGRATAQALLRQGMKVAIGDVDTSRAQDRRGARPERGRAAARRDRPRLVRRVPRQAEQQLGPLDVLVNNAGIMQIGRFIDEDDLTARRMIDINLHGVILGMKLALARMIPRDRGHIVNISSQAGKFGAPGRRDLLGDQARGRRPDRGDPRRAAADGRARRRQLRDAVRRQHRARLGPRRRRAG